MTGRLTTNKLTCPIHEAYINLEIFWTEHRGQMHRKEVRAELQKHLDALAKANKGNETTNTQTIPGQTNTTPIEKTN